MLDGWRARAYDGDHGFAVGRDGEHSYLGSQDQVAIQDLYAVRIEFRAFPRR